MTARSGIWQACAVAAAIALLAVATGAQEREEWRVTYAVRVSDAGPKDTTIRVALPRDDAYQQVDQLEVTSRGMSADIVKGDHPEVVFRGRVSKGKRVSVSYRARLFRYDRTPPPLRPLRDPPVAVLDFLAPAPLFPARSILVREFLETRVAPRIDSGDEVLPAIYAATRKHLDRKGAGASLALDVLRSGEGKRIGIERCFTTLLRCAQFPARFVEGAKLDSTTRQKRVFWTEVWADGDWWPVSASGGWRGRRPAAYLALARDGRRAVKLEGDGELSYIVHTESLTPPARPAKKRRR
ncbi:MAG TPA: transglutaminase domain-containing protein [Terriglobales bacterium]|nr:transglutaminase domain-containing protein [Terriglobales bacterium]